MQAIISLRRPCAKQQIKQNIVCVALYAIMALNVLFSLLFKTFCLSLFSNKKLYLPLVIEIQINRLSHEI